MTNVKIKRIIKFMIVTLVILTTAWICAVISTEPTAYAKSDFAQGDGTKGRDQRR